MNHLLSTTALMYRVSLATLPLLLVMASVHWFWPLQAIICGCIAHGCEWLWRARKTKAHFAAPVAWHLDGAGFLAGLLLGLCLPPACPWWLLLAGPALTIGVKQLYGGLGQNPFNPAMVAYLVLFIGQPLVMTDWQPLIAQVDAQSGATLLDRTAKPLLTIERAWHNPLWQFQLWLSLAATIGGGYLLWRGIIRWHLPVSMLASFSLVSFVLALLTTEPTQAGQFVVMQLPLGSVVIGAWFIVTDPVSAPKFSAAHLAYGALVGALVAFIRSLGYYPDGVAFAIVLANTLAPTFDAYLPRAK